MLRIVKRQCSTWWKSSQRLGTVKQGSGHESLRTLIFAVFSKLLLFQIHLSNLPEAQLTLVSQLSTLATYMYIYNTCIHQVDELASCFQLSVQWIYLVGVVFLRCRLAKDFGFLRLSSNPKSWADVTHYMAKTMWDTWQAVIISKHEGALRWRVFVWGLRIIKCRMC